MTVHARAEVSAALGATIGRARIGLVRREVGIATSAKQRLEMTVAAGSHTEDSVGGHCCRGESDCGGKQRCEYSAHRDSLFTMTAVIKTQSESSGISDSPVRLRAVQ